MNTRFKEDGTVNEDNYLWKTGFVGYAGGTYSYDGCQGTSITFYK